jgi:hypothetical protein
MFVDGCGGERDLRGSFGIRHMLMHVPQKDLWSSCRTNVVNVEVLNNRNVVLIENKLGGKPRLG